MQVVYSFIASELDKSESTSHVFDWSQYQLEGRSPKQKPAPYFYSAGLSKDYQLRISTLDLNKVDAAVAYRSQIRERDFTNDITCSTHENSLHDACGDSKIVSKISHKQTHLIPAEKDELVAKYQNGMTTRALAELYGCHHTTVGRILKLYEIEN